MKTKHLILTWAATLTVGGIVLTTTAAERFGPVRVRAAMLQHAAEKLELTADQKAQIKAEIKSEQAVLQPILVRLHSAHQELRETIRASAATETKVRAAAAKLADAQADLAVERLKLHGKIAPILTATQRAKIAEFEARWDDFVTDALEHFGARLTE